jgi:hypothetical protein
VRELLQLNERLLNKYGFFDVWRLQKLEENTKALALLGPRLEKVAAIADQRQRWENLFYGLLASNIFDSGEVEIHFDPLNFPRNITHTPLNYETGATAVQEILNNNKNFGFRDALEKMQKRPWLVDHFEDFMNAMEKVCCHINLFFHAKDFIIKVFSLSLILAAVQVYSIFL